MGNHVRRFRPNPKQQIFLQCKKRHVAYGGARGGGKSWVVDFKIALLGRRYGKPDEFSAGIKMCLIRRTLKDLERNHLSQLKLLIGKFAKYNAKDKQFIFRNGATLQLAYCDNDNDADHFQGIEYDVIFIEEATQLQPEWIKKIVTSCRGINDFPHRVYYTCNPGGPGHGYIKRLFVDRIFEGNEKAEDYEFIQAKVTDNPILMQYSPEYVSFLQNLPPKIRAGWLEGSWEVYSGQYFNEFVNSPDSYDSRRWTHVINPVKIRKNWTIYRALDWGYFRPFSVGWFAITDNMGIDGGCEDGIMIHFKELYGVQKSGQDSLPNEGIQWSPEKVFQTIYEIEHTDPDLVGKEIIGVADPAIFQSQTGISIADTAMECGVYFMPADNTRLAGWMQCRYRLQFNDAGIPRFYVFNTCREFIRTITTLQHDTRNVEDCDTNGEDHAADMWRYCAMQNMIKPIVEEPEYYPMYGADPLDMFRRN